MFCGLPSRQTVNVVGGRSRACDVRPGDRLWTLRDGRAEPTTVVEVRVATTRAVLDVTTTHVHPSGRPTPGAGRER